MQLASRATIPTVVHLAMNGTAGFGVPTTSGAIVDSSGNGFNATMTSSGASYTSDPAPFGGGIAANGGLMKIPANPAFDLLTSWTDSIWVNVGSNSSGGCLVACHDYDPNIRLRGEFHRHEPQRRHCRQRRRLVGLPQR